MRPQRFSPLEAFFVQAMKTRAGTRNGLKQNFEQRVLCCWDWPDAVPDAYCSGAVDLAGPSNLIDK